MVSFLLVWNYAQPRIILTYALVTYGCKLLAVMLRFVTGHGYSNVAPRDLKYKPFSAASRAMGAHNNGFEALQMISAAVLMATLAKVNSTALVGLPLRFGIQFDEEIVLIHAHVD